MDVEQGRNRVEFGFESVVNVTDGRIKFPDQVIYPASNSGMGNKRRADFSTHSHGAGLDIDADTFVGFYGVGETQ